MACSSGRAGRVSGRGCRQERRAQRSGRRAGCPVTRGRGVRKAAIVDGRAPEKYFLSLTKSRNPQVYACPSLSPQKVPASSTSSQPKCVRAHPDEPEHCADALWPLQRPRKHKRCL